ncbi:MAG: tetratricopeptide repeat protein [Deltaproteobacteria bacterium]|nr:tetratricopeptide repeat protein [Deltaproteobacteria bacterium]
MRHHNPSHVQSRFHRNWLQHLSGFFWGGLCLLSVLMAPSVDAKVRGTYRSPMGKLIVKERGGVITGRIKGENPCGFKKGKVIFEGTRLDDSLTGTVTSCKIGKGCKGSVSGMMMLLISRSGKTFTGAVHLESGSCKTPVGDEGFTVKKIRTPKKSSKKTEKVAKKPKNNANEKGNSSSSKGSETQQKNGSHADNEDQTDNQNGGEESPSASDDVDEAAAIVLFKEGARLLEENKVEEAREAFQAAAEKNPELAKAHAGVGVTYYIRGRYDDTLDAYKHALEANPADGDTYYNMACVYALQKNHDQALNYLRIAALNGFVDWHVFDKDDDLKSLRGDPRFEKLRQGNLDF